MAVFAVFTMVVLRKIFAHPLTLGEAGNAAMLGVWLSNLPLIIASLRLLIGLPYSVNRGRNAISDIAAFVANLKKRE